MASWKQVLTNGSMIANVGSAPSNAGEVNAGARLITDLYGTAPAGTAGNVVSLGATAPSNVGASSTAAARQGMIFIVTDAGSGDELLLEGVVRLSSTTTTALLPNTAKKGTPVYMSTTAGAVTSTAPSTSGDFVRRVGHVIDATNRTIYWRPSIDWSFV